MPDLSLDQLQALQAVVAAASFSAAARQLNLSQPAVSTQIRELEKRFGVRLVERLGKKAFATAAGHDLVAHAQRISEQADAIMAAARRRREGWLGRIRVGASTTALIYHLPPVLQRLRAEYPNIELIVTTGTTSGVVERLMRNELDAGVVSLPIDDRSLAVTPLRVEELVAIFPATIAMLPVEVTPRSLLQYPLILEYARAQVRTLIIDWLSVDGVAPRPAMELDNLEAVKRMVAAGLGVSIVPQAAASDAGPGIAIRPLLPGLSRTLAYIERRNKGDEPALRIVRDAVMSLQGAADENALRQSARKPAQRRGE